MPFPLFYTPSFPAGIDLLTLEEETSRHIVQVLRLKKGDIVQLTDGQGKLVTASITEDHKKKCIVNISNIQLTPGDKRKTIIAISLLKNPGRFEWFLEKATEIGINKIIPLLCDRTEKQKFREERMRQIMISAMIQSQQVWLPELTKPYLVRDLFKEVQCDQKFIAYCKADNEKRLLIDLLNSSLHCQMILIGPEGDFTDDEINAALANHFYPVTLGNTRLRSETAGMVAATLIKILS